MPTPPTEQNQPSSERILSRVDLGDWGPEGGLPYWIAIKVRTIQALEPQLVSAIQLTAQARMMEGPKADGQGSRFIMEMIDDWCGTPPRRYQPVPPRPHWSDIVGKLSELAERYPAGSLLSEAGFDLAQRTIARAHELHNQAK